MENSINHNNFILNLVESSFSRFPKNTNDWLFNAVAYIAVHAYRKGVEDGRKSNTETLIK